MSGSSKGGGGDSETTTVKADPWSGIQPYLTDLYGEAQTAYDKGAPEYYPGETVADLNKIQKDAFKGIRGRAKDGSPVLHNAQNYAAGELNDGATGMTGYAGADNLMESTMRGDYLNPDSNPWLQGMVSRAQESAMPGLNSTFAGSGRTGSGMHQDNLVEGLGNIAGDMYGNAYAGERNNQMSALGQYNSNYQQDAGRDLQWAGLAPGLAAADYLDYNQLMQVGDKKQGHKQIGLNADKAAYDFGSTGAGSDFGWLQQYAGILSGQPSANGAGNQTQTSPVHGGDMMTNVVGTAMTMAPYLATKSDRRLKRDIHPAYKLGQHMRYLFRYLQSDTWHFGVMADEVKQSQPEAVGVGDDGYMVVNYGALA